MRILVTNDDKACEIKVADCRADPSGLWGMQESDFDPAKAEAAQQKAAAYPENQTRPDGAQGALFGIGRTVMPGDKDYNRGSLNPKLR